MQAGASKSNSTATTTPARVNGCSEFGVSDVGIWGLEVRVCGSLGFSVMMRVMTDMTMTIMIVLM